MTIKQIIDYDNPAEFTFNPMEVEVDASGARLRPQPTSGDILQTYASPVGFIFDPNHVTFTGGGVSQANQRPLLARWGANYNTNISGNWGDSPLAPTNTAGTPVVTGGKLDLIGNSVTYNMQGCINASIGTIRWKYTPNYTGNPASTQQFWFMSNAGLGSGNRMYFSHDTASAFRWSAHTDSGAGLINNVPFGTKVLTAGVEYEMEFNYDFITGAHRLFIDGVQQGNTATQTISRANDLTSVVDFRLGGFSGGDHLDDDLVIFDTVQHTAPYVPGYVVADNEYVETLLVCPTEIPASALLNLTSFTSIFTGSPRFIVEGLYWDGAAWVASDNSYLQGTPYADVVANIATINVDGEVDLNISIVFPDSTVGSSITFHSVGVDIAGTFFPESLIYSNSAINMNVLSNLEEESTKLGMDDILHIVRINEVNHWWDGAAWVISDGTSVNANSIADVVANSASLPISTGASVVIANVLISNTGATTPELEQTTVTFTFGIVDGCEPVKCVVYGCLLDTSGNGIGGAKITANGADFFYTEPMLPGGNDKLALISRSSQAFTNAEGEFGIELVETVTDSTTVTIVVEYKQNGKVIKNTYSGLIIPAVTSVPLGNLVNP